MATHNELGRWGEDMAAAYLQRKGYTIVERDWRSGHRDIDIIALDEDAVVFVEVKARRNRLFADPEQGVDWHKLNSLRTAANHYVKSRGIRQEIRLDVVTVTGNPDSEPLIEHIRDFQW